MDTEAFNTYQDTYCALPMSDDPDGTLNSKTNAQVIIP
jgi:hypothetical protein